MSVLTKRLTDVECVVPAGDRCGEGVLWHPNEGAVYWTDINRFLVHRYSVAQNCTKTWLFHEPVTTVLLTSHEDVLALVIGSGLILWRPDSDARQPICSCFPAGLTCAVMTPAWMRTVPFGSVVCGIT